MNDDQINKVFDRQIAEDPRYKVHKELFNRTIDFSIYDWRYIRTEKYWNTVRGMTEADYKSYTLICVNYYIKNIRPKRKVIN